MLATMAELDWVMAGPTTLIDVKGNQWTQQGYDLLPLQEALGEGGAGETVNIVAVRDPLPP